MDIKHIYQYGFKRTKSGVTVTGYGRSRRGTKFIIKTVKIAGPTKTRSERTSLVEQGLVALGLQPNLPL